MAGMASRKMITGDSQFFVLLPHPNNPKKSMRISIWSGLCLLLALEACQSDSKDTNYQELILGRWEIVEALRNGRPTETLTGAYMEFYDGGRMVSNIAGAPEESPFSVNGTTLSSKSERMAVDYDIQYLGDSSMVLKATIRDIPFQFTLTRPPQTPATE
jgi:hypothetical protein